MFLYHLKLIIFFLLILKFLTHSPQYFFLINLLKILPHYIISLTPQIIIVVLYDHPLVIDTPMRVIEFLI